MGEHGGDERPWYERAFDAVYRAVYPHRSDDQAAAEVDFVIARLGLGPDRAWLDLCCGHGRHLEALVRRGFRSVGFDLSFDLLREARRRQGLAGRVLRADMRRLPFGDASFAVASSFFTSFGYFDDPVDDRRVLEEIARVLAPRGRFVIDFLNAPRVRAGLVPQSTRRQGEWSITESRRIDEAAKRVLKDVTVRDARGDFHRYRESVRLYEAEELEALGREVGLRIDERLGDLAGSAYSTTSDRLVLIGSRA